MRQGLNERAQSRQNVQAPRALCVTLLMASAACSASEPRLRSEPTDSKPSTPPGSTVVVELESGITFFAYRSGSSEWRELAVESENPRFEFDAAADGTYSFGIAYGENRGYAIEIFHAARDEVWHWWPGNQPVELPSTPWEGPVSASIQNFDIAGGDVGGDSGAAQPLQRCLELGISRPGGVSVRGDQEVIGFEADGLGEVPPLVQPRHNLADAVDQHIPVVNGRQPIGGGFDLDVVRAALVAADAVIGLGGQGEDGVRHRGHVALRCGVEQVADEEVRCRMTLRQQRGTDIRTITHHEDIIVLSHTVSSISYYHPPETRFRTFTHHAF